MIKLFTRLFQPAPETLLSPNSRTLQPIEIQTLSALSESSYLLQIPPHYSAGFIQGYKYSTLFTQGEHRLNEDNLAPLDLTRPLTLIYLCHAPSLERPWHLHYHCAENEKNLELHGYYRYHINNIAVFFTYLTRQTESQYDTALDRRISASIRALLIQQNIPIVDIETYPDRFQHYLHDALTPIVDKIGLSLDAFSMDAPLDATTTSSNAETSAMTATNTLSAKAEPLITDGALASEPLEPEPREYYLAYHGEQQGPYNSSELQQLIRDNILTPNTLWWKQGMTAWQPAYTLTQLYWYDKDADHDPQPSYD